MIQVGDTIKAYALFGLPPVTAKVLGIGGGRLGIVIIEDGDHYDKVTTVGYGQVIGTPEYEERNG